MFKRLNSNDLRLLLILAIILLVLLVVLLIITWLKNKGKSLDHDLMYRLRQEILDKIYNTDEKIQRNILEASVKLEENIEKEIENRFSNMDKNMENRFSNIDEKIENRLNYVAERLDIKLTETNNKLESRLDLIDQKVDKRLSESFEKTNKTFNSIIERLSKIDEAQKKIESLSTDIVSLQDILNDKKARGTFGEVQLNIILKSIFGDKNDKVFETQKRLSNGKIVDAIIHIPNPVGDVAIDSKFPLENYRKLVDMNVSEGERLAYHRAFKGDLKKHINDIASKYILKEGEQAIMFVPAEAVFAEINAYHTDIIGYAQEKRVWLASPTTLMSMLTTVQVILRDIERGKYTTIIHEELKKLGKEFSRYKLRWQALAKDIDRVHKDVKDINITSSKIENRFIEISNVENIEN